jgi:hypothetical protein
LSVPLAKDVSAWSSALAAHQANFTEVAELAQCNLA